MSGIHPVVYSQIHMGRSTHVVDLTEDDKKTDIQDRQNIQNQRKMGGSPRRRRQIVDTGDTGPYCIVLRNDERTTGKMIVWCCVL